MTPSPEPGWHEQRHRQGQALRVLRSLDCVASLMPCETQADGEGMASSTSGSGMGCKNQFDWRAKAVLLPIQKRTIYLL